MLSSSLEKWRPPPEGTDKFYLAESQWTPFPGVGMGRFPTSGQVVGAWAPILCCVGHSADKPSWLANWVRVTNRGMTRYFCNSHCREVLLKWVMSCASVTRPAQLPFLDLGSFSPGWLTIFLSFI
jgi:hypothetical protein